MPVTDLKNNCAMPITSFAQIRLGHGSGGKMTANLIDSLFLPRMGNFIRENLDDAACVQVAQTQIAVSTDSYVVSPIFFPGGDIGSLAVHGTLNDLAMRGAKPLFLTAAFILEEGLPVEQLEKLIDSFTHACKTAGVEFIAADTKVVNKGACDKIFINTTGIGMVQIQPAPAASRAKAGDCIIVSGDIGRHGIAIMSTREGLQLETDIESDSAPLHGIVQLLLESKGSNAIHCLRDITRGGLATVLNEIAASSKTGIQVEENLIPVDPQVAAICELLGLDPYYVACEGRFVLLAKQEYAEELLSLLKNQAHCHTASIVGRVVDEHPNRVVLRSKVGGKRILDKLSGEQLPRIC